MRPGLLLAWVGGGQPSLLRESPADATRYSAMGAVLVGTAAMAAVSATFALTTAVKPPLAAAIVAGVLWGLLILSLDRMLVISMSGQRGFWRTVGMALPRLALALLIGSVISVPLVLQIFERELTNELQVMHSENLKANQRKVNESFPDIAAAEARVEQLQQATKAAPDVSSDPDVRNAQEEVNAARAAYDKAAAEARCEFDGQCGTYTRGAGTSYQIKKAAADKADRRLEQANAQLEQAKKRAQARIDGDAERDRKAAEEELKTLVPRLEARKAERQKAQQEQDRTEANNDGLLARLEALDRLSKGHTTLRIAHLALLALFACIELLPVLAKLLSGGSSALYEQLLQRREDSLRLREGTISYQDAVQAGLDRYRIDLTATTERTRASVEAGERDQEYDRRMRLLLDDTRY